MPSLGKLTSPGPSLVRLVTGLYLGVLALFFVGLVGYLGIDPTSSEDEVGLSADGSDAGSDGGDGATDPATGETLPGQAGPDVTTAPGETIPGGGTVPGVTPGPGGTTPTGGTATTVRGSTATTVGSGPGATTVTTQGGATGGPGDRTGVSAKEIKWAIHAPQTFGGAPVNLAEDPLIGVDVYLKAINDAGGVNGRTITKRVFDDTYTVAGANTASRAAIDEYKPFFLSGTLGVDQVFVFAEAAKKRGVPYIAGGGSESTFKNIGMFQVSASYDTHLEKLAVYLKKETQTQGSPYFGRTKIGVSALKSPYISPSITGTFKRALEAQGLQLVKLVEVGKPTEQTSYAAEIQELRSAGVQTLVAAQDPITTSRMTKECPTPGGNPTATCPWKWTFSNFANESDVALQLQGGSWQGVRGLAGGCYYQYAKRDDPALCAKLGAAHSIWAKQRGEDSWAQDGSGGTAGYQLVHIWLKALKDAGSDPTRERFRAALLAYRGYDDLVSGPITFAGSPNLARGSTKMVVLEAGANQRYSQISAGLAEGF